MLYKLFTLALFATNINASYNNDIKRASAVILPNKNSLPTNDKENVSPNVKGTLTIYTNEKGETRINGTITGLKPSNSGSHGFHIHEFGDITAKDNHGNYIPGVIDCMSTGDHYNPYNQKHGLLTDHEMHFGDLGNIEADKNGVAQVDITIKKDLFTTLLPATSVIGRAFVIHQWCDEGIDKQPIGNSGGRLACGVIGLAKPMEKMTEMPTKSPTKQPTKGPSIRPTKAPTKSPTWNKPTASPTWNKPTTGKPTAWNKPMH